VSCAEAAEAVKMPFGCGLRWVQGSMYWMGVHIVATWRIRLNRLCAAVMSPFCEITLTYHLFQNYSGMGWVPKKRTS